MAGLTLKKIVKKFDHHTVVHDFDLEIKDKEFLVLVGPSGCGKTTTLRMIAGLEDITSGELYIGDKLVNDVPPKDRDIAMVFQNYALYPHMNVYENMAFGLKLRKTPPEEIKSRVNDAARILGIDHLLTRKPKQLSGGQRQRVALGRAIVRVPQVFLMDEPLSNLDAKLRVQMRAEISKLCQRLETTVVYVTHDQTEAMTMGNRIVVMKDGYIQQVDTPINLYENPVNLFVAGFIGSPAMNFIKTIVSIENDTILLSFSDITLPVLPEHKDILQPYLNKEIIFGIRPEYIHDDNNFLENHKDWITTVTIDIIETMGSEKYLYFTLNKESIVARVSAKSNASIMSEHKIAFDMNNAHFFDPHTEKAII